MASRTVIPRFLLPLQGPLWRGVRIPLSQNIRIQFASNKSGKPIVLEKPLKFNPPSHGSRLKKNTLPKHYGPELTFEEKRVQSQRDYPGMMAPDGTWAHWFWHSRLLHTFITMGTLLVLGICTFFMNYAYNSPFKDLVPPISDLWSNPVYFFVAWKEVIISHEKDKAIKARDHRMRHIDDVAKRQYFMKTHGIETKDPVSIVFGKSEKAEEGSQSPIAAVEVQEKVEEQQVESRKKWFGIF